MSLWSVATVYDEPGSRPELERYERLLLLPLPEPNPRHIHLHTRLHEYHPRAELSSHPYVLREACDLENVPDHAWCNQDLCHAARFDGRKGALAVNTVKFFSKLAPTLYGVASRRLPPPDADSRRSHGATVIWMTQPRLGKMPCKAMMQVIPR